MRNLLTQGVVDISNRRFDKGAVRTAAALFSREAQASGRLRTLRWGDGTHEPHKTQEPPPHNVN